MSGRQETSSKKASGFANEAGQPPANSPRELCVFCLNQPSGAMGHSGFTQQVYKIPISNRSFVRVACVFCGASWARRRASATVFEWRRIAD